MHKNSIICVLLTLAGAACASSQAEQVKDARMEQTDAHTVAATRNIEEREAARNDAIDRQHENASERAEASDRHDENAAKGLADVRKDRADFQSKVQARIETIGVRIRAAREKLATVGQRSNPKLQSELKSVENEHQLLKQDVMNMPETSASNWEESSNKLDERLTTLNEHVKDLTGRIEQM